MPQAQVGHQGQVSEAAGAMCCGLLAGCLLQAVPSEVHLICPAELLPRGDPECLLGEGGSDQVSRVAVAEFGRPRRRACSGATS